MRFPRWTVPAAIALVIVASGCSSSADTSRKTTTSSAPATSPPPASAPVTVTPATPTATTASTTPVLKSVEPRDVVILNGTAPKALPNLQDTNGNDYPKTVYLVMRDVTLAMGYGVPAQIRFVQVGTGENIECGGETMIASGTPSQGSHVAWWCPKHQILLTSPAGIIADHSNDSWQNMRDLAHSFSTMQLLTTGGSSNISDASVLRARIVCTEGRLIWGLHRHGYLSADDAKSLARSYGNGRGDPDSNVESLWKGYSTGECG